MLPPGTTTISKSCSKGARSEVSCATVRRPTTALSGRSVRRVPMPSRRKLVEALRGGDERAAEGLALYGAIFHVDAESKRLGETIEQRFARVPAWSASILRSFSRSVPSSIMPENLAEAPQRGEVRATTTGAAEQDALRGGVTALPRFQRGRRWNPCLASFPRRCLLVRIDAGILRDRVSRIGDTRRRCPHSPARGPPPRLLPASGAR